MSPPIGTGGGPPGEGSALVADVERYVAEWKALLARGVRSGAAVESHLRASPALQDRARRASFGGLAHHLSRIDAIAAAPGGFNPGALEAPLRDISEFLAQMQHAIGGSRPPSGPPLGSAQGAVQLPRMVTHLPGVAPRTGAQPIAPGHVDISLKVTPPPAVPAPASPPVSPPVLGLSPIAGHPGAVAPPPPVLHPLVQGLPPNLTGAGKLPPPAVAPGAAPYASVGLAPLPLDVPRDPALTGPMAMPDVLRNPPGAPPGALPPLGPPGAPAVGLPPPQPAASPFNFQSPARQAPFQMAPPAVAPPPGLDTGGGGGGSSMSPPPQSMRTGAPKLMVRTMFGLRAFGRQKGDPTGAQPAVPAQPGVLGLRSLSSEAGDAPQRDASMPRMLNNSLPPLPGAPREEAEGPPPSIFGDLMRRRGKPATESQKMKSRDRDSGQRRIRQADAPPRRSLRRRDDGSGSLLWAYIALGVIALGSIVTVIVLVVRRSEPPPEPEKPVADKTVPTATPSGVPSSKPDPAGSIPRERLLLEDEGLRSMLSMIHGKGKESPELRALVDDQAALLHRMVTTQKCQGSTEACDRWNEAKDLLTTDTKRIERRRSNTERQLKSRWLAGLTMPDIPIEDDPLVQRAFESITVNPLGRERFVSMLFRCGAYWDLIRTTLQRYELPQAIMAVVFTESGCVPTVDSPVGARGLWQFMPETGRAYHLRIIEGKLDERMSPVKSTEAAVHYLSDLKQKLNSWDLVFASYNLGPYGVLARVRKAGDDNVTFWDLADADYLPEETRNYVPYIQAYALVLANLRKLNFGGTQKTAPENTADLEVPSGTRLTLVARVASTSLSTVKKLNPDILSDLVPAVPSQRFAVQVPKDNVWQARDTLAALMAQNDEGDLCVPPTFDWGKQRFTDEMQLACGKRLAAPMPTAAAPPLPGQPAVPTAAP